MRIIYGSKQGQKRPLVFAANLSHELFGLLDKKQLVLESFVNIIDKESYEEALQHDYSDSEQSDTQKKEAVAAKSSSPWMSKIPVAFKKYVGAVSDMFNDEPLHCSAVKKYKGDDGTPYEYVFLNSKQRCPNCPIGSDQKLYYSVCITTHTVKCACRAMNSCVIHQTQPIDELLMYQYEAKE